MMNTMPRSLSRQIYALKKEMRRDLIRYVGLVGLTVLICCGALVLHSNQSSTSHRKLTGKETKVTVERDLKDYVPEEVQKIAKKVAGTCKEMGSAVTGVGGRIKQWIERKALNTRWCNKLRKGKNSKTELKEKKKTHTEVKFTKRSAINDNQLVYKRKWLKGDDRLVDVVNKEPCTACTFAHQIQQQQFEEARTQIKKITQSIKDLVKERLQATTQIETFEKEIKEANEQIETSNKKMQEAKEAKLSKKTKFTGLQAQTDLFGTLAMAEIAIKANEQNIEKANNIITQANKNIEEANKTIKGLNKQIQQAHTQKKSLQGQLHLSKTDKIDLEKYCRHVHIGWVRTPKDGKFGVPVSKLVDIDSLRLLVKN